LSPFFQKKILIPLQSNARLSTILKVVNHDQTYLAQTLSDKILIYLLF